jgi:hypothetical protein
MSLSGSLPAAALLIAPHADASLLIACPPNVGPAGALALCVPLPQARPLQWAPPQPACSPGAIPQA